MEKGSFDIPKLKILKLSKLIAQVLSGEAIAFAGCFDNVTGKIISMSFSFGNICLIMTKHIQDRIDNGQNRVSQINLGQDVVDEPGFLFKQL